MKVPVVLITGGSSGIGLALCKLLKSTGKYRIIATARPSSLHKIPFNNSDDFWVRPLDVVIPNSGTKLTEEASRVWGGVDILINNAGISFRSVLEEMSEVEEQLQMQTNYFGPLALIRAVLPGMRKKRSGQIINVSSVGGMMAMPTMGSYSASKFALEGASEALWYELKPWNVQVTLVQPGFVNSDSFERVYLSEQSKKTTAYKNYYSCMHDFVGKLMHRAIATPESIAKQIAKLLVDPSPPLRLPVTLDAHLFGFLRRILPRSFYHRLLYSQLPDVRHWVTAQEISIAENSIVQTDGLSAGLPMRQQTGNSVK